MVEVNDHFDIKISDIFIFYEKKIIFTIYYATNSTKKDSYLN